MKVTWKSCFKICCSVFLLYICITYWKNVAGFIGTTIGAAMPLIVGCIIAYIINILMTAYENHYFIKSENPKLIKTRRPVCMLAAFITLIIIVLLLLKLVVPQLIACGEMLIAQVPGAIEMVIGWIEKLGIVPDDILESVKNIDWQSKMQQIIGVITSGVGSVMGFAAKVASSVFSGIVTGLFAVIFSIYLLTGKEKLADQFDRLMKRYLKDNVRLKIEHVLNVMNDCFHKYIVGQCTDAVILGVLCMVGMLIFKFPYATMIGAVVAFTALIPVAGGYIGAAIGAFMILTVSPMKALLFVVYIIVLQQLEGNLIYPRVVGSSLGLPAIWVLAAVMIGGGVMGIPGMLIGVPLAATLYRLLRENMYKVNQN